MFLTLAVVVCVVWGNIGQPMVTDTLPDLVRLFCGLVALLLTILPIDLKMFSI